jgi:hypothetical protein
VTHSARVARLDTGVYKPYTNPMNDTLPTPANSPPPAEDERPWYRKKAERPKTTTTFHIFTEHKNIIETKYKGRQSAFSRYIMDCFFKSRLATPIGFDKWQENGEKF